MMGSFIASDSQAMTGLLGSQLVLPMPNCRAHTMEGGLCNSAPIPTLGHWPFRQCEF